MPASETDVRLHERLIGGDDDALAEIYDSWSALVYSIAARIIGDRAAAEDVTQEVFVRLWERPHAYDPRRGTLRTWLCMTSRSRAVDWIRSNEARNRYQTAAAAIVDTQPEVDDGLIWQMEIKAVREAVQSLPEHQRSAVLLAFYHQRTYRQVAQDLQIPEGTAKSRLRVGLATLASRLAAEGIIDP
ncbi:RNA polymerase sigma factor SigK [Rhizocola hellebori]|uniref:RNA polymerase sigma factor SigK n=1 Tax=Rhizocola hellebori TaxID=1392758 RepID=A0A8J3VCD7_9ACTN|nr:sigma-70 family RNA polymerase sigma factor [Rhizocola hellebori]GIH02454.1 RNA polymerase sigma factor SigK [Rhizocola hellebori]